MVANAKVVKTYRRKTGRMFTVSALAVEFMLTLMNGATIASRSSAAIRSNSSISRRSLADLGNQADQPILRLIVTHIMNLEKEVSSQSNRNLLELVCHLHGCAEWGTWSRCDAMNRGEFGTRSRRCLSHTSLCEQHVTPQDESEAQVCENRCPDDYTITAHGFCLKMYSHDENRFQAETTCRGDHGHLVNVDSELAMNDLNDFILLKFRNTGHYWIDGRRSEQEGLWLYERKPENRNFFVWGDNEPTDGPDDLCRLYNWMNYQGTKAWRMNDFRCNKLSWFICEIIV